MQNLQSKSNYDHTSGMIDGVRDIALKMYAPNVLFKKEAS